MKKILAIFLLICCGKCTIAQSTTETPSPVIASVIAGTTAKMSEVVINPNPVKGASLSLELNNVDKGKYTIYACNTDGKKFVLKTLTIEDGNNTSVQSIELPKEITAGTYILQVISKTSRYSKKMMVE